MQDDDDSEFDVPEAIGRANAAICVQAAITATLVTKGILAKEDAATISGLAAIVFGAMGDMSPETRELGQSAINGFGQQWLALLTRQ